jgi:hypothetical protein
MYWPDAENPPANRIRIERGPTARRADIYDCTNLVRGSEPDGQKGAKHAVSSNTFAKYAKPLFKILQS